MANSLQSGNVEVVSVKQHGLSDDIVVRVEARVNGEFRICYLRMEHSLTFGWRIEMETTSVGYYLALL